MGVCASKGVGSDSDSSGSGSRELSRQGSTRSSMAPLKASFGSDKLQQHSQRVHLTQYLRLSDALVMARAAAAIAKSL